MTPAIDPYLSAIHLCHTARVGHSPVPPADKAMELALQLTATQRYRTSARRTDAELVGEIRRAFGMTPVGGR